MNDTKKGDYAQLKVETIALEKGYVVSRPSVSTKYDVIIDDGNRLWRVQIKYADGKASHTDNAVIASLNYTDRSKIEHTYKDSDIDALAVYVPKIDKVLWFLSNQICGKSKLQIKIAGNKNTNSIWYEDYIW